MTDKSGGGVSMNAKDINHEETITSYDGWNAAVKGCVEHFPMSFGSDDKQRAAMASDVLSFIRQP